MNRTQQRQDGGRAAITISPGVVVRAVGLADDGAAVVVRAVGPADLDALRGFFAGLSTQSRYLRFFGPIVTPSPAMLDLLAGRPGHVDALVAMAGGVIVGHAMAADRTESGTRRTDIGVVVADAWQGRGVGAVLVRTLIGRAGARGVTSVVMDVMHGNRRALTMITDHWPEARVGHCRDYTTVDLRLSSMSGQAASKTAATPWPPPTHMVSSR